MYWEEEKDEKRYVVPDDVVDVTFSIVCRSLPVDHAHALLTALQQSLPWLQNEEGAGVHPIHVADSGNGWMRPENPDDLLYLSHRTKLVLRLPRRRVQDAQCLCGKTLEIAGNTMQVESAVIRPLSTITTLFSRYVVADEAADESAFLETMLARLKAMGIRPTKMLCGMEKIISTPQRPVRTRSLMLANLGIQESITLQQRGLGPLRLLGCGLFIPHKDINEVKQKSE